MSEGKPYTPAEIERAALSNYLYTSLDCDMGRHQRCQRDPFFVQKGEACDCPCHAEVKK